MVCDHYTVECMCDAEHFFHQDKQRGKQKKTKDEAETEAADNIDPMQMIDGDVTVFVAPEHVLPTEVLQRLTNRHAVIKQAITEYMDMEFQDLLQGNRPETELYSSSSSSSLAVVPMNEILHNGLTALKEEAKEAGDEILKEDLYKEASVGLDNSEKISADEHKRQESDERVLEVIKEMVVDALKSTDTKEAMNQVDPSEVSRFDDETILLDQVKTKFAGEEIEYKAEETPELAITSDVSATKPVRKTIHHKCTICANYAHKMAAETILTQDPTISLEGAKLLFDEFNDTAEEIARNVDQAVAEFMRDMDKISAALLQEMDQVLGPTARPVAATAQVLITDVGKVVSSVDHALENMSEGAADKVEQAALWAIDFVEDMCNALDWLGVRFKQVANALDRAATTMAHEAKGIASDILSRTAPFTIPGEKQDEEKPEISMLSAPSHEIILSTDEQLSGSIANKPKQTPLRWLGGVIKTILAPTTQSSSPSDFSAWPASCGLTEWPVSGKFVAK